MKAAEISMNISVKALDKLKTSVVPCTVALSKEANVDTFPNIHYLNCFSITTSYNL